MPNSSAPRTGVSLTIVPSTASLFDPSPLTKVRCVAPQGQVTVSKGGSGWNSSARKTTVALPLKSFPLHLPDRNTLMTLGLSSEGIFLPAAGMEGGNGGAKNEHVKALYSLSPLGLGVVTGKTCEQLVYTAREKPVGKHPQKMWTTSRTQIVLKKPVHNSPTYPPFPPHPSPYLPTRQSRFSTLLQTNLSAVSTAPTITTTIYITNK